MKQIIQKFADWKGGQLSRSTGWAKLGVLLALAGTMVSAGWAQPANDNFANAVALTGNSGTVAGSNVGATLESCEPVYIAADDYAYVDNSVWYKWTATTTGTVEFDTFGSSFDTVLAVYTTPNGLCDPNLTLVAANDDSPNAPAANPYASQVSFTAVAGTTYYISVDGNLYPSTTDSGSIVFNYSTGSPAPANDNFANATTLTGYSGSIAGTNVGATLETCEPTYINTDDMASVDKSVWYAWTAPFNGAAEFDTFGSSFDTVLAVYTTPDATPTNLCAGYTLVAANDDSPNAPSTNAFASQVYFSAVAGTTYYISVDGNLYPSTTDSGTITLNWASTNSGAAIVAGTPSGTFQLTAPVYTVSERDSQGVNNNDNNTVQSLGGAVITVTRSGGYDGRVSVGYVIAPLTYTNVFVTNTIVTNFYLTTITNGITTYETNYTLINVTNNYGYYEGGYKDYVVNGGTNTSATNTYVGFVEPTITNVAVVLNVSGKGRYPANAPALNLTTNTDFTGTTNVATDNATYTNSVITNLVQLPSSLVSVTAVNYTNTFGTNTFTNSVYVIDSNANGIFSTNYILTTVAYSNSFSLNNQVVSGERTNYTIISSNIVYVFGTPFTTVTFDPGNTNGDLGYTNVLTQFYYPSTIYVTNIVLSATNADFTPVSGAVAFDDYQMNASFTVPLSTDAKGPDGPAVPGLPRLFSVTLTNASLDPEESSALAAPGIEGGVDRSLVSVLSDNFVTGDTAPATNSLFNFEEAYLTCRKDVGTAIVSVLRSGGSLNEPVSVQYTIDPTPPILGSFNPYNTFPLSAGSDYALPNSDYTPVTGTLSWAADDATPKQISIPILNNGLVEPNVDMLLKIYNLPTIPASTDLPVGEVNEAHLTILFDDYLGEQQPAGAVDRTWNQDGVSGLGLAGDDHPFLDYPGTSGGNNGQVYAVAEQPNGDAIIAGSFVSYNSDTYNDIVRVLPDGEHDSSFLAAPNTGANDYITTLALQPNGEIIAGGNFTSFDGLNRHHIALLNTDGSVDTNFNPGLGANGIIWSVCLETNGQMIVGGDFSSYNGTNITEVARLNADGSLDPSFMPGTIDGNVTAVAVDSLGRVLIGGNFNNVWGVPSGGIARLNVDGSLDTTFNPGIGTYNTLTGTADQVYAITIQTNGQILVGGAFSAYDLSSYNGIVRLNTDATVDTSFEPGTGTYNPDTATADTVYAITLQPDGNILVGGDFQIFNQTRRAGITRLFSYGSVDTSFMDTAYNEFAGVPNPYFNENAVNTGLYPVTNTRNFVRAIALEAGGNPIIGGSFARVGGGFSATDIHNRSNVARLVGGSTPGPGNIQFLYNSYSVDNTAGNLFVSLVRTNGSLGAASVTFGTNTTAAGPGVAVPNVDFSLSPIYTDPTWPTIYSFGSIYSSTMYPGVTGPNYQTTPTGINDPYPYVYVAVNDNTNSTGNLSASMTLTDPFGLVTLGGANIYLGVALGPQASVPLTIIDDNTKPGTLAFSTSSYFVAENAGYATITLNRTGGSDGIVQVSYATGNGTANSANYTSVSGTLTFTQGQTSISFNVPVTPNSVTSTDKTVLLSLYNATGGAQLGLNSAVLTIINTVTGTGQLNFTQITYGTNENAGTAYFTISRLGGSTGQIIATNSVTAGTAVNKVNFTGSTNVLTWTNQDTSARTIGVPLFDDGVVTSNLTVNLNLYGASLNGKLNPGVLGLYTNATLIISNVDAYGSVEFSASSYAVKKFAGSILVPVERVGGSAQTVTVNYLTMDGTATQGLNYTTNSGTLTFTNGQVSQYISVPIVDDGQPDGPLYFSLVLTNASPTNSLGSPSTAQINIIDTDTVNEPPGSPDVTFSSSAGFNSNVYSVTIEANNQILVGGDFTQANGVPRQHLARLNYDGTLDADFLQPSDASGANGTVRALAVTADGRILAGGNFTTFNQEPMNYIAVLNNDGSVNSTFNPGSGADNPVYALSEQIINGGSEVVAGGAFTSINGTTFNGIARLNSDGTPDTTFNPGLGANATVYALAVQSNGKIIIGGDFTAVNGVTNFNHIGRLNVDGSVDSTFNPTNGGVGDSVRAIAVQLDGKILIGGLFTNAEGMAFNHIARLNSDGTVDASFQPGLGANDDVFSIGVQTDGRIVLGGQFTLCSGVTRNRITRLNPNGSVDPTINFGTGASDFVAAVAIQEGTISGYPTNVPDEKIILAGGFTQYDGQTFNHLVRVYGGSESGSGAFQFSSASYQVNEDGTNIVITVQRTGGTSGTNADLSGDIYVPFASSAGSATPGINYSNVVENLDFPEGEVIRTVTIPVFDDGVVTSNLTVNLALGDPFTAGDIGNIPTATLYIINDDSTISFSSATYSAPKNIVSGVAAINVVRQGATYGTSTAIFSTIPGGTATPTTDYTPVEQAVTFAPGVSNVTVAVPINNNGIAEGNQTVDLALSGITGSLPYSPTNAVLTIIDTVNAPGQFSFSATNYTVTEGGGSGVSDVLITVNRTDGSSGIVSVHYNTFDGTAQSGLKYISTNNVLTFGGGANASSESFLVQVINTSTAEGPEYFGVELSNPTGNASLGSPTNATVTILNTNTGIAFVSATNQFTEPFGQVPGSVTLNVIRYNNTNGTTVVGYYTTNDLAVLPANMAVPGTNYVPVNASATNTVTFNPGDSIKPITITTLYDPAVTPDLYFNVALTLATNSGAQLTAPSVTTVIDHDVNVGVSFFTNLASVYKNAGSVAVVVYTVNTNQQPVSVNYATGGGSAVAGVDYTAEQGTVVLTNNQVPGYLYNYIYVPILPNNLVQTNKSFNLTLSNPTDPNGTAVIYPIGTEAITIISTNTPYGLSFSTPIGISNDWGSATVDNSLGSPELGDPTIAGNTPTAPVWFQWTAPANGEVTLDTIGSVATNGLKLDTVLGVFTGSSLGTLNQVAANDDMYPMPFPTLDPYLGQENDDAQFIFNTNSINGAGGFQTGVPYTSVNTEYLQPFGGPSLIRFNAQAGVTYYFAADTKLLSYSAGPYPTLLNTTFDARGPISLNWAYHPSGVFRFATERTDLTGLAGTNGNPLLLYQCAETESSEEDVLVGTFDDNQIHTTVEGTYYNPSVQGLLVTVTRVAGSTGRVSVDYTNVDGNPAMLTNGDLPAVAGVDYTPVGGTLIFDDYEMSKSIFVPITYRGIPQPNHDFTIVLSNPQRDPQESGDVSVPRVDPIFGTVLCRILNCNIDPNGATTSQVVSSNAITGIVTTNLVLSLMPTNAVINFGKAAYRIPRDEETWFNAKNTTNGGIPITVYVDRFGTNEGSVSVHWRIDNEFLNKDGSDDPDYEFPVQPGSDYAVPTPASADGVDGTNSDFAGVGGDSGTITFPAKTNPFDQVQSQSIQFNLDNNYIPEFNRDLKISLYGTDSKGNPIPVGMNSQTTVSILFNDEVPPAGSADQLWNPDFAVDLAFPTNTGYLGSALVNPGTELYSDVYSLIVLPTNNVAAGNQTIIAGAFTTYEDENNTYTVNGIARLNYDGTLDTSFNPGSGVNVFPGGEFIRVTALTANNQILIGGDFSSFNGTQRNSIARLNSNGSVDTTFNPGSGLNGTVWAMALQPNGQVVVGGDFTMYNGSPANYIARINTDGSLDTTFNAGTNFNGAVYALALQNNGSIVAGGVFTSVGGPGGQNCIARLNSDGSLDTTFDTITGANASVRSLAAQPDGKILAGGEFTLVAGESNNHIVRFNTDGSLDTTFNAGIGTDGTVYDLNYNIQYTNEFLYFTNVVLGVTNVITNTVAIDATNSIYVGGTFTTFNGTRRAGFARLYTDGSVDTTFLDTSYNQFAGLPRIFYNDSPGTVYASGVQTDGNIMIAGSFQEVGGGQADKNVRNYLEEERGLTGSFADPHLWVSEDGTEIEPKSRDGVRNRGNVARLIGGVTAGPGNIGFQAASYAVNKTQSVEPVTLVRTNGSLGYASANFAVIPGLAKSGSDYSYYSVPPLYPIQWEYDGPTRDHFDGFYGPDGQMDSKYGEIYKDGFAGPASENVNIINDTANAGNLSASFQLANPADADIFYLGGENIAVGVALGESAAPLTLVDNAHQDGVFGFASSSFTTTNPVATITIARTNSLTDSVIVSYKTVGGGTAVNGFDYLATNGPVTFNAGQAVGPFSIIVLQNSSISTVEKTVNMQLYNIQDLNFGDAYLGLTNAVLRIINPNFQGYLSLSTNYYITNLDAGSISFTVNRTVGSKGTLTVQYATTNGTAFSGVDYIGATNTLTWNNGDVSSRTITIPLLPNTSVYAGLKQFGVNIYNATLNNTNVPSLLEAPTFATLNIINNNSYGTFQFSAPQYLVNDKGGSATITVTRTGSALGTASVGYFTADASAVNPTNYVQTTGTLNFAQGQLSASFNIPINADTMPEPPPASFFFDVVLTNASEGAALGAPSVATVNIVDSLTYNQPPGGIDTAFNPSLIINGSVLALGLQSDGQIVAGGIFTSVNGANYNHVARLNTDGTPDTTFMHGLAGADGYVNALVNQTDDRILLGGAFANVNGTTRNGVARLMTDGTLDTSFVPGSGADNSVYALAETFINGSRELYAGGAFSTYNGISSPGVVRLNNDGTQDTSFSTGLGANGTVYALAAYPTNAVYYNGDVLVGGGFTNFDNVVVGNLVRLNQNGSVDTNFGANLLANGTVRAITIQADGNILIGGDFTMVDGVVANHLARLTPSGALDTIFASNLLAGVNGSVDALLVQPDNRIVVAGQFNQANGLNRNNLTRINANGSVDPTINFGDGANGAVNAVVLQSTNDFLVIGGAFTVFEDQPLQYIARVYGGSLVGSGQFSFNSSNYQIDEDGGFATITVVRTGGSSGPNNSTNDVYVSFSTTNGTAVAGVNYIGVTNELLDFPLGQVFQTITIPVQDDGVVTPNLTVNMGLAPVTVGAGLGDQPNAILTIINDDSGVSFAQANYSVPKNTVTGVAEIEIVREGSTSGSCTVDFATDTNGTATIGTDYYPTNEVVTFNPGDSEETVQVPIINNTIPEGQRTVGMLLTNATGFTLTSPTNAILTIIDTVTAPGQLSFATNGYSFVKANTSAMLTVVRTNGASGKVTVNYATVAGTALPGLNYLNSSGTLTLNDGVTSGTISIPLLDNSLVQGTVNFTVNLSSPTGGAALITPTNAVVSILDHNVGVSFQSATNYTIETSGSAVVFVQRVGATNNPFYMDYDTTNITAAPGTNYTPVSGTLYFAPGATLEAISIPVIYDHLVTGDLLFGVNLLTNGLNAVQLQTNALAGLQLVYPTNALVVIHDADAGLSFTNSTVSVLKNVASGSLVIPVICSNPSVEPVIVNSNTVPLEVSYYTTNGTATAGVDYTAQSGTLVFTNMNGTNYITVPIIDNGVLEGNRTFNVVLYNPTAPGQVIYPGTNTVTIIDINSGVQFSSPTYTVLKTGIQATIDVYRTGYTNSTVAVNYATVSGTAVSNVNYTPVNGTLTFTNGVTDQQFTVPIISSTAVQPDLTVFLQLSGATNAILSYPSFSTLTIIDLSGGDIVPAGAVLVTNQLPTNSIAGPTNNAGQPFAITYTRGSVNGYPGLIYPGMTNTLNFAFRDSAGTNVSNVVATLLPTNGVTLPSGPQNYGSMTVYGPSVSRPFTFTAVGTNGQSIVAAFSLSYVVNGLSTNSTGNFTFYLGTWSASYSNTAPIIINDYTTASPYPSVINVSGLAGVILGTTVTLTNLSHTSPADIEALAVAPNQQDTLLMANTGGGNAIKNVTLMFSDSAATNLPTTQSGVTITNGTYKPTSYPTIHNFP